MRGNLQHVAAWCCWPWLGKSCALKGQLDCSQQDATIPARARRADTREHWENPVLSWEKKLAAECFSKF